jgi:hypothetical protein
MEASRLSSIPGFSCRGIGRNVRAGTSDDSSPKNGNAISCTLNEMSYNFASLFTAIPVPARPGAFPPCEPFNTIHDWLYLTETTGDCGLNSLAHSRVPGKQFA